jgi:predicted metal-dependent phosphoesterase TrpH
MRIDLHAHSTASDGTEAPSVVMAQAAAAGLDVVALTDHDTTDGWAEAIEALPPGLTLVPGIELSSFAEEDGNRISLHLLCYLPDPDAPGLQAVLAHLRDGRDGRGRRTVELLEADGVPISWEQVERIAAGGSVGRPHVARALVENGVVPDVSAAFAPEWLKTGGRYYVEKPELPVLEAIALALGAGGIPVFAHPEASRRGPVVADETYAAMANAGLVGLEADHPDHDEAQRARVRGLAKDLGLVVTGSSDYHGTSKSNRLGDDTTAPEVYELIVGAAIGTRPVRVA